MPGSLRPAIVERLDSVPDGQVAMSQAETAECCAQPIVQLQGCTIVGQCSLIASQRNKHVAAVDIGLRQFRVDLNGTVASPIIARSSSPL